MCQFDRPCGHDFHSKLPCVEAGLCSHHNLASLDTHKPINGSQRQLHIQLMANPRTSRPKFSTHPYPPLPSPFQSHPSFWSVRLTTSYYALVTTTSTRLWTRPKARYPHRRALTVDPKSTRSHIIGPRLLSPLTVIPQPLLRHCCNWSRPT